MSIGKFIILIPIKVAKIAIIIPESTAKIFILLPWTATRVFIVNPLRFSIKNLLSILLIPSAMLVYLIANMKKTKSLRVNNAY
jgi:hypothetical protein